MSEPRFYVAADLQPGQSLELPPKPAHRVAHVLRMRVGQGVRIFNHQGQECAARIRGIRRQTVTVEITGEAETAAESAWDLRLALAVSKPRVMDHVLQKAVEMGVRECVLLHADHSPTRCDGEIWESRRRHWEEIIIHATEQCGRVRLCALRAPQECAEWLAGDPSPARGILLHPQAGQVRFPPVSSDRTTHGMTLIIGAEGGWSERELEQAKDCETLSLGSRIMRVETAVVAAIAICRTLYGDFRHAL